MSVIPTLSGRLALSKKIGNWSRQGGTSLQQRSPRRDRRTAGPALRDAHYYWLLLAEGQLTRQRFGSMLRRIAALPLPNGFTLNGFTVNG